MQILESHNFARLALKLIFIVVDPTIPMIQFKLVVARRTFFLQFHCVLASLFHQSSLLFVCLFVAIRRLQVLLLLQ
jgi:hypothetical protein